MNNIINNMAKKLQKQQSNFGNIRNGKQIIPMKIVQIINKK